MQVAYSGGDQPSSRLCCVGHVWMSLPEYELLTIEAQRRRMHPDALLAKLTRMVIAADLFRAVLDP
jgi:hypothetical protein